MKIQTLSVVVPTSGCVNNCVFCVSKTHSNPYVNMFKETKNSDRIHYKNNLKRRLQYASLHGVDTIILTGIGEVLQNMDFLHMLNDILTEMNHPFPRIELQTSGVLLNDDNILFLTDINVNTISISVSNLFDNDRNLELIDVSPKLRFTIEDICDRISKFNLNIRLSLNLTSDYNNISPEAYFKKSKSLGATHVTFRKLYSSANNTPEDKWVNENKLPDSGIEKINNYIKSNGKPLYVLPFGYTAYSVNGISTVLDDNCMDISKNADDILKYLILRENGKLFTQWDDEGSLIFWWRLF